MLQLSLGCALLAGSALLLAADEEVPDAEFLEYLGMWEESEEDWLIFEESVADTSEEQNDPVPRGEEPVEQEDES